MKLNNWTKALLAAGCFIVATIGFLIKLPAVFQHHDKVMHSLFYFLAAAFLNILFANRNIIRHVAIFIFLYLFGIAIEYAQEYSNKFLHKRIHGRYDVEDVRANFRGLVLFSILWIAYTLITVAYHKLNRKEEKLEGQ